MADDAMSRVRWKAVASNLAHAFVGGRYAGSVVFYTSGWCVETRATCMRGRWRRRCDAKRAVELALSGGAAPMPGYVHPRHKRGGDRRRGTQ